jgi:hypothetical protein
VSLTTCCLLQYYRENNNNRNRGKSHTQIEEEEVIYNMDGLEDKEHEINQEANYHVNKNEPMEQSPDNYN